MFDISSVIEADFFCHSDIFEEVFNCCKWLKASVGKKNVNLMMSSGQILGIRFLDKLFSEVGRVQSQAKIMTNPKSKYYLKIELPHWRCC